MVASLPAFTLGPAKGFANLTHPGRALQGPTGLRHPVYGQAPVSSTLLTEAQGLVRQKGQKHSKSQRYRLAAEKWCFLDMAGPFHI